MPIHPAAPTDVNGLIEAYSQSAQAVVDLGRSCREADFERETDCPGWTVKDVISHVVGIERWLAGDPLPRVTVPDYPHIRSDAGRFTEIAVEARRSTPGADVVDELAEVVPRRQADLYGADLDLDSEFDGPFGPGPAGAVLAMRVLDIWTHEQDLREALGRPGNLDSAGASIFLDRLEQALPRIVARTAAVPPGVAVLLDLTGPVVGRLGVRVDEVDGRPRGIPLFLGESGEGHASRTTSIVGSTQAVTRRAAGRRSRDELRFTVLGDEAVGARVLDALVFTI